MTRLGDSERDGLAAALGHHYAEGRIDAAELDRRLDVVYGGQSLERALEAVADLPPGGGVPAVGRRRVRGRHGEASSAEPGWLPTVERFRDPSTRRVVRVWVDPADGSRHYVPEPGP